MKPAEYLNILLRECRLFPNFTYNPCPAHVNFYLCLLALSKKSVLLFSGVNRAPIPLLPTFWLDRLRALTIQDKFKTQIL